MNRPAAIAVVFILATCLCAISATAQLPSNDGEESFEVEPPVLIPNLDRDKVPVVTDKTTPAAPGDPDKLEKQVERAKRSAAGADRLVRIGALAKVEAEQRALRVVRLEADLAEARLALAKQTLAEAEQRVAAGEVTKTELVSIETALAHAIEAAHAATANRERAEVEAAETNLHRQQKLLALGSGRRSEVNRAEQKLSELRAPKNN